MRILFVHQGLEPYVKEDLNILRSSHQVRESYFPGIKNIGVNTAQYLVILVRGLLWCDLSFSWFGKLHAFFSVLISSILGKKSVVVVSGGEVCRYSLGNGRYNSLCTQPFKRHFPRYIAKKADLLLPVSKYVHKEALETVGADPQRMKIIYHGFDTTLFRPLPEIEKQPIATTVAILMDENLYCKGLPDFIKATKFAPDVSFILIGPDRDGTAERLRKDLPKNALLLGGVYGENLVKELSRATVYVQASAMESFGCAVAEAMACECVPVVARIPALREVVGDCGLYLDDPITPQEIAQKVQVAMQHPELGKQARQRVIDQFNLDKRKRELLNALATL